MKKVDEFINEFLNRYEKKKKIVEFILSAIDSKPELRKDKNFMKAVLIFSDTISDVEMELMSNENVDTSKFMDIVAEFEEELIGADSMLNLEDLEDEELDSFLQKI